VNGQALRTCRIGGPSLEHVLSGAKRIWEHDETFQDAKLAIPDKMVSVVIGKSGQIIKEVQDNCGVQMSFCKAPEMGRLAGQMRCLTIKGDQLAIINASIMVHEIINDFTKKETEFSEPRKRILVERPEPARIRPEPHRRFERDSGRNYSTISSVPNINVAPRNINAAPIVFNGANNKLVEDRISAQFFVIPDLVPLAIGKGGVTIKHITAEAGNPDISFELIDEEVGENRFRRVTVSGAISSVVHAACFLAKLDVQNEPQIILLLPDSSVSFIIGSHGEAIRQITDYSRAFLSFAKKEEMGILSGTLRSLIVKGSAESIQKALTQVLNMNQQCNVTRGEKRSVTAKAETKPTLKKAKWDITAQESDICIALPLSLRSHFTAENALQIEQTYGCQCVIKEEGDDYVIHISGDNALGAQHDLQVQLSTNVGPIRWQMRCDSQ